MLNPTCQGMSRKKDTLGVDLQMQARKTKSSLWIRQRALARFTRPYLDHTII